MARMAILRIVGDEVRDRGACELTLAEIAARAGSCRTMARTTLRQAAERGLVLIEERRRPGQQEPAQPGADHLAGMAHLVEARRTECRRQRVGGARSDRGQKYAPHGYRFISKR